MLLILLRLIHIVCGAAWVGMMIFTTLFLMPAIRDVGPPGGAIMAALQRRKIMVVIPVLAVLTIISGLWLLQMMWGGMGAFTGSRAGQTYAVGGVLAIAAFLLGITIVRPAMVKAAALAQGLNAAKGDDDRKAQTEELERLRRRTLVVGRVVLAMLVLATAAMALARYAK
jgi:uncharacterized membrane protein